MSILFIGKFQPPHLGPILTVCKLVKKYKKITIGITEGGPKYFERKKIKQIFNNVFNGNKNINIVLLSGAVDKKSIEIKRKYKFIISGNKKVLGILKKLNFKTKYQPRTKGYSFSGKLHRRTLIK